MITGILLVTYGQLQSCVRLEKGLARGGGELASGRGRVGEKTVKHNLRVLHYVLNIKMFCKIK